MNIFAVIYCYPPLLAPATLCYLKMLIGLREAGFGITVLTRDPASFDERLRSLTDPALNRLLPEGIRNIRIKSWESNAVFKTVKALPLSSRLFFRLFEPRGNEWHLSARRALKKTDLAGFDVILSCSQPHVNHLIGHALKRATGKPWIAYFSDPWTDNPYTGYASRRIYEYHLQLEDRVIRTADAVLFTSGEMADLVMRKYPEAYRKKCGVLPHCFIPEWYEMRGEGRRKDGGRKTRVIHTGHFYGPRTPMPFLRALAELSREIRLQEAVEIYFFGKMDREYHAFIREKGLDAFLRADDVIPYLDSLSAMRESDYLLLIDAPLQGTAESVFLPSKLIDYIGSFRPVVGITPEKGASARVLRESGNVSCCIENQEEIYREVKKMVLGSLAARPDRRGIMHYHYAHTTGTLAGMIGRLV